MPRFEGKIQDEKPPPFPLFICVAAPHRDGMKILFKNLRCGMDESTGLTFTEKFEFRSRRRNMMWSATQKTFSLLETRSIPLPPSIFPHVLQKRVYRYFFFAKKRRNQIFRFSFFFLCEKKGTPPSIQDSPRNVEYQEETFLIENRSLYLAHKKTPSLPRGCVKLWRGESSHNTIHEEKRWRGGFVSYRAALCANC